MIKRSTIWSKQMKSVLLPVLAAFLLLSAGTNIQAQLSLTNGSPSATIDFSNSMQTSVGTSPATAFAGAGFEPNPTTAGRLNSNAWAVTGWSNGNLAFGGTQTTATTDYVRNATAVAQSTGGMYAYTGAPGSVANPSLMFQPGGSDWEPGTITLRIQNNGTTNITDLVISYNLFVRNDGARSSTFNFSHSSDDLTYTPVAALDYASPLALDAAGWVQVGTSPSRTTTITGLNILPGSYYYIRWSGAANGGTGSRDEFGLDDISVAATFGVAPATPTQLAITSITPSAPYATATFDVTVRSVDGSLVPSNVTANTGVSLSLNTGSGVLGGTLTGTILAGTNTIVISGVTYSIPETGVILTATRTSGDLLSAGNSAAFNVLESATNLTISAVNGGGTVFSNQPFSVTVTSRNSLNATTPVLTNTGVSISLNTGTGSLSGTLTGTILAGQSSVTITGIIYSVYETNVVLNVTRTSGDLLTAGTSAAFDVSQGLAVGDVSIVAYEFNDPDKFAFVTWVDLTPGLRIKFTDNAFLSNGSANAAGNARGGEEFVIWQNTTGLPIAAGTVVHIQGLVASAGTLTAGTTGGIDASLANSGDQIFAYQGAATSGANPDWATNTNPTTFNGFVVHGLTAGTAGWLPSGIPSTNTSYLPSELNVTNGNIALVNATAPRGGQYTGTRNGFATFNDYKNAVNNPANWTLNTSATPITIDQTAFTLSTGSAVQLRITEINNGLNPSANVGFTIQVDALDGLGDLAPVGSNTTVEISVFTGTGVLAGTYTGVITTGNSSIFIGPMTYDVIENGVVLLASATAGDVLAADQSDVFDVLGGADHLEFVGIQTFLYFNNNIPTFTVEARRSDNSIDLQYNGPVTISILSGLGTITGTVTQLCFNGVATFGGLQFSSVGNKVLQAESGTLTDGVSPTLTVSFTYLTEIIFPQYMQGTNNTNNNRIPVAFRANLQGLIPNATYRYFNLAVESADGDGVNGAGIPIIVTNGSFVRLATPSLGTAGSYGEFTTNGSGAYTGWFMLEASANDRFVPGNDLFMRIVLNDGAGGSSVALRLTSALTITTLDFTGASLGSAVRGTSSADERNFVVLYDNVAGTGRPVACNAVESDGIVAQTSYASFYRTIVDGVSGSWGVIVPNNLPNGIRRIEQRRRDNGERVDCGNTDGDGVWPSGANTVNPTNGGTAVHITATDATLQLSQAPSSINATVTSTCPGNPVTLTVVGGNLHQGGIWRWFSGSCGSGSISTGPTLTVNPLVTTTYYVRGETACHQTTCASITITVGNCPSNDSPAFATPLSISALNVCFPDNGDLTTANVSPEATSSATTGEDVWYSFVATEPGVRINVTTTAFDAMIELQTAGGTTLDTENAVSGTGNEILNYVGLTVGQSYRFAVRNFNSAGGTGAFSICLQRIADSGCNYGPGPYGLCNTFKANATFANTYTFTFTNTTTSAVTVINSTGSTVVSLGSLLPGYDYNVSISATYNLLNGAGATETFIVAPAATCTITMSPHTDIDLRSSDTCPAVRNTNSVIGATSWLCGATYYEWEFTQTSPVTGLPFYANGPSNSRFIALSTVAGITAGATYDVRIRPWFAGGTVSGDWGPDYQCLQIAGVVPMILDEEEMMSEPTLRTVTEEEVVTTLYPNPNTGERVILGLEVAGKGLVFVRITDATGRLVYTESFTAEGIMTRELNFAQPLNNGLYLIEVMQGTSRETMRMLVQK